MKSIAWRDMLDQHYFEYGDKEKDWLKSRDKVLGVAIDERGRKHIPVYFPTYICLCDA